jgi:hypothetical protein
VLRNNYFTSPDFDYVILSVFLSYLAENDYEMKKRLNTSSFALLILFSLSGCDKDSGIPGAIEDSVVTKVEGPVTGSVGQACREGMVVQFQVSCRK